jgi:hypothetical protein
MTWVPADLLVLAEWSGGECSGTLNGRDIQSVPARIRMSLRGEQSCAGSAISGSFEFKLAGRKISGTTTYNRVGPRATFTWKGDGGGQAAAYGHALIGMVREDDPVAQTPVVGESLSGPVTHAEVVRACAEEGLSEIGVTFDAINTAPSISG